MDESNIMKEGAGTNLSENDCQDDERIYLFPGAMGIKQSGEKGRKRGCVVFMTLGVIAREKTNPTIT